MHRHAVSVLLALLVVAGPLSPAEAHRLKVFATVVGARVEGKAYFVGGGPAQSVSATLRDRDEKIVAEVLTDREGRFALTAPAKADLTVVVDARDGHVARFAIAAARLPDTLPPVQGGASAVAAQAAETMETAVPSDPPASASADEIAAAVARQIEPLAEQLDSLEASIRLRDVLGGLGYIVGIFGLVAFLTARRSTARKGPA